jgi:hypothetical protein
MATTSTARGDLTDELIEADIWSDEMVARAGIPVRDYPLVSVGGGIGSYALVDTLRIAGAQPEQLRVLTNLDFPYQTYRHLTNNSQIPPHERIRSDSASVLDNIWGWPSYAVREAFSARSLSGFIAPLLQVLVEPIFTDYYTPKLEQVFQSVDRETARLEWADMLDKGQVRMSRRRHGGGYFTILTPPEGTSATRRIAFRSTYVHISVGYPGLQFLPDLQEYRQKHQDYGRVVNAYEPHDYVYADLLASPGTVVVRGSGIVASRVLQRLIDDIEQNGAQTKIVHLFRTYVGGAHGPSIFMRRKGGDGFAYQGFNWPKSAWGGQMKQKMEEIEGEDRLELLRLTGGTNTPKRKLWQQQLKRCRANGAYRAYVGQVSEVVPGPDRTIITRVNAKDGTKIELAADYIIDATGLEGDVRQSRVLADLLDHGGAGLNPYGRLDVERTFELRGAASPPGRMYAVGSMTLGGYHAGVDTFLGLQTAALHVADDLARQGFVARIGMGRSLAQWLRWARRRPPS